MRATIHRCLALLCASLAGAGAQATDDVPALLKAADRYRTGADNLQVETHVSVLNRDGSADKERRYTVFVQAQHKSLVLMRSPAEAGQKVLMLGDDFWLLMPGSQRPLRITPSQKLLGDASTGDIATLSWADDYTGSVVGDEPCGAESDAVCQHLSSAGRAQGRELSAHRVVARQGAARTGARRSVRAVRQARQAGALRARQAKRTDAGHRDGVARPVEQPQGDACALRVSARQDCARDLAQPDVPGAQPGARMSRGRATVVAPHRCGSAVSDGAREVLRALRKSQAAARCACEVESTSVNDAGPLAAANALVPGIVPIAGSGLRLEAELRGSWHPTATRPWLSSLDADVLLAANRPQGGPTDNASRINELHAASDFGAWQLDAGKKIVGWDVGYGFRPNDVVQQERRRTLLPQTPEGRRAAAGGALRRRAGRDAGVGESTTRRRTGRRAARRQRERAGRTLVHAPGRGRLASVRALGRAHACQRGRRVGLRGHRRARAARVGACAAAPRRLADRSASR